jgi:hypothetical protein
VGQAGDRASAVTGEPGPRQQLEEFRRQHREVLAGAGPGFWQAVIPRPGGLDVITRDTLEGLLDELEHRRAAA